MSIIYDTKWALLALFPEQAEVEKVREEEARIKAEQEALKAAEEEAEPSEEPEAKEAEAAEEEEKKEAAKPAKKEKPEPPPPRTVGLLETDFKFVAVHFGDDVLKQVIFRFNHQAFLVALFNVQVARACQRDPLKPTHLARFFDHIP